MTTRPKFWRLIRARFNDLSPSLKAYALAKLIIYTAAVPLVLFGAGSSNGVVLVAGLAAVGVMLLDMALLSPLLLSRADRRRP